MCCLWKGNTQGHPLISPPVNFKMFFLRIKPVPGGCWKCKANTIRKWKGLLCLQLTDGCVTHGKGNAPQYTLPDSGTRAGSPRWHRTFPHSSSSSHRSAARRTAQRSPPGSGRWAYLSRWGDGEREGGKSNTSDVYSGSDPVYLLPPNASGSRLKVYHQIRWQ